MTARFKLAQRQGIGPHIYGSYPSAFATVSIRENEFLENQKNAFHCIYGVSAFTVLLNYAVYTPKFCTTSSAKLNIHGRPQQNRNGRVKVAKLNKCYVSPDFAQNLARMYVYGKFHVTCLKYENTQVK